MKAVTDYPKLIETLQESAPITYLCGAGLSMSLGNHNKSWWHWLNAGKDYLSNYAQSDFDKILGSGTTPELINAAGFLLKELKTSGKYADFMKKEITSIVPVNDTDIAALRLLTRSGDFIATTNYDTSIEKAVNLGTVTYSRPGEVLQILKGMSDRKVIHLHGAYIPSQGIDDIIADEKQYTDIVSDKGAQFIQQLIGTNPIVIVGCGGTTEDPNMSGFLTFCSQYLKSDIPYFYLCKDGDDATNIPDNFIPVCYGSEYEDLPEFLFDITSYRIRHRADLNAVEINPYIIHDKVASAYGRMHFLNRFNKFIGRNKEMRCLKGFYESPDKYSWWIVLGDGGIGKSRLLLESLGRLPSNWFGFFGKHKSNAYDDFKPFADTVVVFDYVIGDEINCAGAVSILYDKFERTGYKLRIVFLERSLDRDKKNWITIIQDSLSSANRLWFDGAKYKTDPIAVNSLSPKEEIEYISSYIDTYFTVVDDISADRDEVEDLKKSADTIEESFRKQLPPECYRPLFLSIFVELWIYKNGTVSVSGVTDLLEEFLKKEERRWKTYLTDEADLNAYLRILPIACADRIFCINEDDNGYLQDDCDELTKAIKNKIGTGKKKHSLTDLFIREQKNDEDDGPAVYYLIEPVYPDIIREFIVDYYVDESEWKLFACLARHVSLFTFGTFLTLAMEDFPDEPSFQEMALTKPEDSDDLLEMFFTFLISRTLLSRHSEQVAKILLDTECTDVNAPYEMEVWRRMAFVLHEENRIDDLYKCSESYFEFVNKYKEHDGVLIGFPTVTEDMLSLFFEKRDLEKTKSVVQHADEFYDNLKKNDANIATICAESHWHLADLKDFKDGGFGVRRDWNKVSEYYDSYPDDEDIANALAETTRIYLRSLTDKGLIKKVSQVADKMEAVSKQVKNEKTVGTYAICLSDVYGINSTEMKKGNPDASWTAEDEALDKLEKLIKKYPDNADVAMSYGVAKSDRYLDRPSAEAQLTESDVAWYRGWFEKYKDNVEFAESYARILSIMAEKYHKAGDINKAKATLNEIRKLSREVDFSEYHGEDENVFAEMADQVEAIMELGDYLLKGMF